LNCKKTKNKK